MSRALHSSIRQRWLSSSSIRFPSSSSCFYRSWGSSVAMPLRCSILPSSSSFSCPLRSFSSYPSRANMRRIPVSEYPAQDDGEVRVEHTVAPEFLEPLPPLNKQETDRQEQLQEVFQPSIFAIVDINGKQTKVHAGCLVMTDNLNLKPLTAFKRHMMELNGVGKPDYRGPHGERLQQSLLHFWERLSPEERQPFIDQQIEVGDRLVFDHVLLLASMDWTVIGRPLVKNVRIHATVREHAKTEPILVFKKKRRKGYAKQKEFEPMVTILHIDEIVYPDGVESVPEELRYAEPLHELQEEAEHGLTEPGEAEHGLTEPRNAKHKHKRASKFLEETDDKTEPKRKILS